MLGRRRAPIAKCQAFNDEAINIGIRKSGAVPNLLHRRITRTCGSINRIVFTGDADDHSATFFAAKLALVEIGERPACGHINNGRTHQTNDENENGFYDQSQGRTPLAILELGIGTISAFLSFAARD